MEILSQVAEGMQAVLTKTAYFLICQDEPLIWQHQALSIASNIPRLARYEMKHGCTVPFQDVLVAGWWNTETGSGPTVSSCGARPNGSNRVATHNTWPAYTNRHRDVVYQDGRKLSKDLDELLSPRRGIFDSIGLLLAQVVKSKPCAFRIEDVRNITKIFPHCRIGNICNLEEIIDNSSQIWYSMTGDYVWHTLVW